MGPECLGLGDFWVWGHSISWSIVLEIFLKTEKLQKSNFTFKIEVCWFVNIN
jgi:hypothetical protein